MRRGFTLVELVVIILVLGILAGVAAPKFFRTAALAADNGLRQTLTQIRKAIELHAAYNTGAFPPCTGSGTDFRAALEPYLRGKFPKCPVGPALNANVIPASGGSTVGAATPTDGWKFNVADGTFICNFSGPSESDPSIQYDSF